MTIETERLSLILLTARQLKLWVNDLPALEQELNCSYDGEPVDNNFRKIVSGQIAATEQDESNYMYHSFWLILRKKDRLVVGSSDFKAPPDKDGKIEIGYGLGKTHEHHGYMTETVKAMCDWAKKQKNVSCIIAETNADNIPSQHVLLRCGFRIFQQSGSFWWKF